jgi:hypothetical protein
MTDTSAWQHKSRRRISAQGLRIVGVGFEVFIMAAVALRYPLLNTIRLRRAK